MEDRTIDRRTVLAGLPIAAWLQLTHGHSTSRASASTTLARPRLQRLELATSAELAEMKRFYGDLLGLTILEDLPSRLTIAGGATPITFVPTSNRSSDPFYHFAFNIPENKILASREWQLERTPLELPPENLRDPNLPIDIVHFRSWDAHSIYFWDPGGNFVEYIARHTLDNAASGAFSSRDILYASEIALVTDDTAALANTLQQTFELPPYVDGSSAFRAVGDEHGLLLVMLRGRVMGWQNGNPIDVASADIGIHTGNPKQLSVPDSPYQVRSS